jgi:hypothetical protein
MNSKKNPGTRLTVRLPKDLADAAAEAAKDAGMAVSDYHRFALRQAVDRQSAAAEMAAVEERMAAQLTRLHRRFGQLYQAQHFQFAVLDQFMKMALTLEPDFVDEATRVAARTTGRTRYKALMDSVPSALDSPLSKAFEAFIAEAGE